jgi:chloride channel protein, CIC family
MPQVLGTGYGWGQLGLDQRLLTLPRWLVLALPFAKILTTGLSIGAGGAGGIFGPGMVVGGMLGAACWRRGHGVLPGRPNEPASFTIIAMMALFGGIAHAPLAVMLMVAEMTGNLSLLAPALVAVGLATLVVGNATIYRSQLPSRVDSPAHRYQYAFPLLATLMIADALEPAGCILRADESVQAALVTLEAAAQPGAPVVDAQGLALDTALDALASTGRTWAPVTAEHQPGRWLGLISIAGILQAYRQGVHQRVRRATEIAVGSVLLEVHVTPGSPLLGQPVRALVFPPETLLVAARREGVVR